MERVDPDDHPLASVGRDPFLSIPGSTSNTYSGVHHRRTGQHQARSPSTSLIQSAVRSVLDDATPSTIVSDDRSVDSNSYVDGNVTTPKSPSSPTLASLQMEHVAPIPNEQDRRRFIVSVANSIVTPIDETSLLFLSLILGIQGCLAAVLASAYDYDEADNNGLASEMDSKGSFAYLDYTDEDSDQESTGDRQSFIHSRQSSMSTSFEETEQNVPPEEAPSRSGRANARNRHRTSDSSSRQSVWGTSAKESILKSLRRTRRRRYDVFCRLLVSSSELLLLDKSVARAFLPMLSRVLIPPSKSFKCKTSRERYHRPTTQRREPSQSAPSSPSNGVQPMTTSASFLFYEDQKNDVNQEREAKMGDYIPAELDEDDVLRPFLEPMTPGSGFRCLSLLLLQHLLTSEVGYDARIRHVFKKLGVIVLVHDSASDSVEQEYLSGSADGEVKDYMTLLADATRKFDSLEHSIARRLILLSETKSEQKPRKSHGIAQTNNPRQSGLTKEKILRGVKIGSAGIVAGTLFALTGGIAAPGIAAGVAAVAGSTAAATAAVVTLTSTVVVTTIFGVGGGSLAAYKMQRRTQGLTEFEFHKEWTGRETQREGYNGNVVKDEQDAELFSTICISGWLRDKHDFQRPWGLHPTAPRLADRVELLERFYSVYRPDHLPNCTRVLASWKGEEKKLWSTLRDKYGKDPDSLFPFSDGPRIKGRLTLDQEETLDLLFVELGYNSSAPSSDTQRNQPTPFERMKKGWKDYHNRKSESLRPPTQGYDSMHGPHSRDSHANNRGSNRANVSVSHTESDLTDFSEETQYQPPTHLATVWDYSTTYGGELYTVRWESDLLKTICDCVMDLAMDVVSGATRQILKQTILSTFLAAIVWPSYLLNVANMIDGDWTLAVERADQAGKEMARTLLFCRAGQRPVTLVGFSFGARVIYACLKELARLQDDWEEYHEVKSEGLKRGAADQHRFAVLEQKISGMKEPASVVEDAIMMGLPNHLSLLSWKACRQIVAGRLVNCFSTKDLILSLMFQAKRFSPGVQTIFKPVCGTCEVGEPGVENIDISDLVHGHQDYCLLTGKILERVKLGDPLRQMNNTRDEGTISETSGPSKRLQF